jgi:preprotein translocase subunit SecE
MGAKVATKAATAGTEDNIGGKMTSWTGRTRDFLGDVRTEMRKVTTPAAKEVRATTTVVIITVFLFALYFYLVDGVFGYVIDNVFRWARTA